MHVGRHIDDCELYTLALFLDPHFPQDGSTSRFDATVDEGTTCFQSWQAYSTHHLLRRSVLQITKQDTHGHWSHIERIKLESHGSAITTGALGVLVNNRK